MRVKKIYRTVFRKSISASDENMHGTQYYLLCDWNILRKRM